jgi:hypothetical protein
MMYDFKFYTYIEPKTSPSFTNELLPIANSPLTAPSVIHSFRHLIYDPLIYDPRFSKWAWTASLPRNQTSFECV